MSTQFDINIVDRGGFEKVPLDCPVCEIMLNPDDMGSYEKYECCNYCALHLAQPNSVKWLSGWRPDKESTHEILRTRYELASYKLRSV